MMKLKGCPRCGGDLQLEADSYGKYQSCLQCGFLKDDIEVKPENQQIRASDAEIYADLESGLSPKEVSDLSNKPLASVTAMKGSLTRKKNTAI
jgi:hypothetical protein